MEKDNKSLVFYIFKTVFSSVSVLILLLTFVFRLAIVDGPSMQNTLYNNDVALITNYYPFLDELSDKYIPYDISLKQGDIVAIAPSNESDNEYNIDNAFIKRIIATEGQTIGFDTENGAVYVDGEIIDEPYISSATLSGVEWEIPDIIPKDKVFVMGDNRNHSTDSRFTAVGLIDEDDIVGKAQFIVYPFDRAKKL